MKTKRVVASKNPVPMEENSRRYIGKDPVTVDVTNYYARRIMSGELVEAPAPAPAVVAPAKPAAPPKEDK